MEEKHFGPLRFIPGEAGGKYPYCNSLYIEGAGVLIDPSSNREALIRVRDGPGVLAVWLTHWHEDHWMHMDLFDDVPLWISEEDADPLSDVDSFLDAYRMKEDRWVNVRGDFQKILEDQFRFKRRVPDRVFGDGEEIKLGDITVQTLHTPGHTPGHFCFFFPTLGVLHLGDYDLTKFGPWYGDKGSTIEETVTSVRRLQKIPAVTWTASHEHGMFDRDPGSTWEAYLDVIRVREEKLLETLAKPRTMREIMETWIVYGRPREPRWFFEFGEWAIVSKHLEKLGREGRVLNEPNGCFQLIT